MSFELARPVYLLLLLAIVPMVVASLKSRVDLRPWRLWGATVLRIFGVVCLVLALAGLKKTLPADRLTVLFLVDRSLSVGDRSLSFAEDYVEQARQSLAAKDRFGVLLFGRETALELGPGSHPSVGRFTTQVDRQGSDLATAIQYACANFPADSARRIVLLSDGNETVGRAETQAQLAAELGVEVWTVPLPTPRGQEYLVESVTVPGRPAVDSPFDVKVVVGASTPGRGWLTVTKNGRAVARQQVEFQAGRNVFLVPQRSDQAGVSIYQARLEVEADTNAANNRAEGVAVVAGPRQLLYVAGKESGPLPELLRQSGLTVTTIRPAQLPTDLPSWQAYQAVVFDNVSAFEVSPRQLEWVQALTRELGMGFAMLGGDDTFGVGGFIGTPLERVLPVELDIRRKKKLSLVALAMAIDKSGSMSAGEGGIQNIALAREGAIAAASFLTEYDSVGVIGFDSAAKWVVPMQKASDKKTIARRIGTLRAGGGTDLYPAFRRALTALSQTEAPVKHLIILSDGAVAPADYDRLLKRAQDLKVTVSTVAVGSGADTIFLKKLAEQGNGRAYYTDSGRTLPRIFTRDTVIAARAAFSEKPFLAKQVDQHPILDGLDLSSAPPLLGYNLTTEKAAPAQALIVGPGDDPVLAVGRHGLGKTLAWTSDNGSRWALGWKEWPPFSNLMVGAVRYLLPDAESGGLKASLEEGQEQQVLVEAEVAGLAQGALQASLIRPDGSIEKVAIDQTNPTRFEGSFRPDQPGNYILYLSHPETGATLTRTWTLPYSREHRRLGSDRNRLMAIAKAGQGRFDPQPQEIGASPLEPTKLARPIWPTLVILALLALPLEVALRRVFLPGRKKAAPTAPKSPQAAETVAHLKALKKATASAPVRRLPKLEPKAPEESPSPPRPESEPASSLERLKKAKKRAHD